MASGYREIIGDVTSHQNSALVEWKRIKESTGLYPNQNAGGRLAEGPSGQQTKCCRLNFRCIARRGERQPSSITKKPPLDYVEAQLTT